jgi:D-amino-acid dehydrogenase
LFLRQQEAVLKLAVIGSGVIGITTAYELTLDGHEVTVFERRNTAAEESSFANGSLIAPGWNAFTGMNDHRVRALMPWASGGGALPLTRLPRDLEWGWIWNWLRAGKSDRYASQQRNTHQLTGYSHERMRSLTKTLQLNYDRTESMLVLWRTEQDQVKAQAALQIMASIGWNHQVLSARQARMREPALNAETALHAALEITGEASANARQFALQLKSEAQKLGCRFEFGATVNRLSLDAGPTVTLAHTSNNTIPGTSMTVRFDGAVICAGSTGAALLRPLGLRLPLLPVLGHSISAAVREPLDAPLSAVLDAHQQVSIARLGQRVRISGGHQIGGTTGVNSASELKRLYQVLSDWFPGAASMGGMHGTVQEWQGTQGCLPDGLPVLGPTRLPGLWVNMGHGDSGWSMACGSARALADHLRASAPDIDLTGYSPARFGL